MLYGSCRSIEKLIGILYADAVSMMLPVIGPLGSNISIFVPDQCIGNRLLWDATVTVDL